MILIVKPIPLTIADNLAGDIKGREIPSANPPAPVDDPRRGLHVREHADFGKQIDGQKHLEALRSGQTPNLFADMLEPPRQSADPRGSGLRTFALEGGTHAERMASFISRTARSMPTSTARA